MQISEGPKQTRAVPNFFDDEIGTTSRELLFDGKRYQDLDDNGKRQAQSAIERKHRDQMGGWAFLVALAGGWVLFTAPLTLAGIVAVVSVTALICWAMVTKL